MKKHSTINVIITDLLNMHVDCMVYTMTLHCPALSDNLTSKDHGLFVLEHII